MRVGLLALCATAVIPRAAHAGRTFFGWLYGTDVMPERGVEVQTFVSETNIEPEDASDTAWWLAPAIGVTDKLELLLPIQFDWTHSADDGSHNTFTSYGGELRYRFVTPDPVDAPPIVPLIRVALNRLVIEREHWQPQIDVVVSATVKRAQLLLDIGALGDVGTNYHHFEIHPGAGVSIAVTHGLRLGAEVFGSITLDDNDYTWLAIGPNAAWTWGRMWISAAYGIGLYHIRDAPKLNWGIAF